MGVGEFNYPIGRSVYNGLQTSYKQQMNNAFRGVSGLDLTISYTLSRFVGTGGDDQNFSPWRMTSTIPQLFLDPLRWIANISLSLGQPLTSHTAGHVSA